MVFLLTFGHPLITGLTTNPELVDNMKNYTRKSSGDHSIFLFKIIKIILFTINKINVGYVYLLESKIKINLRLYNFKLRTHKLF